MINIFYGSKTNDAAAKKENKRIAEAAKLTIKEVGPIDVISSKTGGVVAIINNKDTIIPYWGGVNFELSDEIDSALCEKRGLVKEICYGAIPDKKDPKVEARGIEKIII